MDNLTQQRSGAYSQNALSPKLGIVYQVVKEKISFFANYMNGFKNVANSVQPDGTISIFRPQHANQLEGGLKLEILDNKLDATLSYYNIAVTNSLRPQIIDDLTYTVQDGTQESKGIEAEVIGNPFTGFNFVATYGYNDNQYINAIENLEGKRAVGTPEHVASLWLSYTTLNGPLEGLGVGGGVIYVSDVYYNSNNSFILPEYTVVDATLFYDQPKYRISLKANNILDQKYWISDGYYTRPQKPAHFLASVAFKF